MSKNYVIKNKNSNQLVSGKPKLPTAEQLQYGEIAINYAAGNETIAIKNSSGDVVTFSSDSSVKNNGELKTGQTISYRKTNVDWDAGAADIKKIYGKTYAWNQLLLDGNFESRTVYGNGFTFSISNNTLSATATSSIGGSSYIDLAGLSSGNIIASHKYYCSIDVYPPKSIGCSFFNSDFGQVTYKLLAENTWTHDARIFQVTGAPGYIGFLYYCNRNAALSADDVVQFRKAACIDLTLMFGAGNEPSTVEEFEALFPGYHDYNPGELISNDTKELETVGFNLWDEEWVNGYWSGNEFYPNAAQVCPKNFIPCLPNTTYFFRRNGHPGDISAYDSNKQIITEMGAWSTSNISFTTPANAAFLMFYYDGPTYNYDMCLNISDPSKNGTYEPYEKHTLPLNLNSFQVKDASGNTITIEGGLKSAGNVYDEIVGNKYIKRVGSVDLGTLNYWVYEEGNVQFYSDTINDAKLSAFETACICSKYIVNSLSYEYLTQPHARGIHTGRVYIVDTGYSDGSTFKTAMSGVMMNYELATPITYELVSPLITEYPVDKNGTERAVYENETDVHAPLVADIQYGVNNNDTAANISDLSALSTILTTVTRRVRRTSFDLNVLKQAVAEQNLEKYGLKVGDETTINGYTYVIAGLNPMAGTSTPYRVNVPHVGLIVIPHTTQAWNVAGNTYTGADGRGAGYKNCDLHYYLKNTTLPHVQNDLGSSNLISHYKLLSSDVNTTGYNRYGTNTGCASSWAWEENCYISALSEIQVYGSIVWSSAGYDTGEACRQLDVFRVYNMNEIFKGEYPWLRDIASASLAAHVGSGGIAAGGSASDAYFVAALILFH